MKAVTYKHYGSPEVLRITEVPTPQPKADQVLIRIKAAAVSTGDWRARSLDLPAGFRLFGRIAFGICGPRQPILGTEAAGTIVAIGSAVTKFKVGDAVFACPGLKMGAHAEYLAISETGRIAHKPKNLNFEQAAALTFGGLTALSFLRDRGEIKTGDKVLIVGASGSVGNACVQIAKHFGAHVTGVCSTRNVELVRSWGADEVVDYTKDDFTRMANKYDIILDTTATTTFARCKDVMTATGKLLIVNGSFSQMFGFGGPPKKSQMKMISGVATEKVEDVHLLGELANAGAFVPYIDEVFPFTEIAKAHALVDTGRKRGNVIVTIP